MTYYKTPAPVIQSWDTWPHTYVPVASLAQRWCESPHTIRKWIHAGQLEGVRLGHRTIRVTAASARVFEERNQIGVSRPRS